MRISSSAELGCFSGGPVDCIALREELTSVPQAILERASSVRILDLSNNRLSALPEWIAQLEQLEVLFLSNNHFSELPEVVGRVPSLRMIGMRDNQIDFVSADALPARLEWLTLTNNHIAQLPPELGRLSRLRKLLLAGNRLQSLPDSLCESSSLELLRLSANRFESFPRWLWSLPSLAWIALAGNPCTYRPMSNEEEVEPISWRRLHIGEELGRGASGKTYRATLLGTSDKTEMVAVKVFTNQVSSDGHGRDEIAAAVAAGVHPNLVSTRAPLCEHPSECAGLILDLIPEGFHTLAAPPSFQSCTRDMYPESSRFSISNIVSYAHGIAAVAHHLHSRGIVHGDLYAHNTLIYRDRVLVSDFGAACIYRGNGLIESDALERVEVRAYGILLDELLSRRADDETARQDDIVATLQALADDCCGPHVGLRPSFADVLRRLPRADSGKLAN